MKIKNGNRKVPRSTSIFNMSTAHGCYAKKLGLCKVHDKCYAMKPEVMYPRVMPYRSLQAYSWLIDSPEKIAMDIIGGMTKKTDKVRFNESGDFTCQADIDKLNRIVDIVSKHRPGIIFYGYTARADLDFTGAKFVIRGSGFACKNGQTTVLRKGDAKPKGWFLCPGSCKSCSVCAREKKINVAFRIH